MVLDLGTKRGKKVNYQAQMNFVSGGIAGKEVGPFKGVGIGNFKGA